MARMRLIADAYAEIKRQDPCTALTLCALTRMVKSGIVPVAKSGRKTFVNYDALLAYLENPLRVSKPKGDGTVRKID